VASRPPGWYAVGMRIALLALLCCACVRNPATGKLELDFISESQEIEMGKQAAAQTEQQIGLYKDAKLEAYVTDLGNRLSQATPRKNLPWQFHIVDDPAVNAFALPGGPVFVTRGLLTHVNSEAELATVMGHECGHIAAHHSANQISKQEVAQVGLGLGSILSPAVAQLGQAAGAGLQLLFLKFSRDDERQADWLGFGYAANIGYDATKMVNLMTMLAGLTAEHPGKVPNYLQTHPDPGERLTHVQERIKTSTTDFSKAMVNRDQYLALIDNIVYGEDPRQGYFQNGTFYHPGLKLQVTFPQGWQTQNQPQAVAAMSPKQDAMLQLEGAPNVSPEQAAQQFFSQQGVQRGETKQGASRGLATTVSSFAAQTQQGQIAGVVSFFAYGGQTWAFVGYSSAQGIAQYGPDFEKAMASFAPLTDPSKLSVEPARLKLVKVEQDMTVEEFNKRHPSTAPLEKIALINNVAQGELLKAGQTAKMVVGGPPSH
jgi:predicted Zn-dependent protease